MIIRGYAGPDDRDEWLRMRRALWEDCSDVEQVREMDETLNNNVDTVFLVERPEGGLCGFLVSGRANPASAGRLKTSHFEETQIRRLGRAKQ